MKNDLCQHKTALLYFYAFLLTDKLDNKYILVQCRPIKNCKYLEINVSKVGLLAGYGNKTGSTAVPLTNRCKEVPLAEGCCTVAIDLDDRFDSHSYKYIHNHPEAIQGPQF